MCIIRRIKQYRDRKMTTVRSVPERPPYEYEALPDGRYIRLLVLEPGGDDDELPVGNLELVTLEEAPPFEAISYVWGSSELCEWVKINDKWLPATRSVVDALLQVRLPDRRRTVWVDSVCINQRDDTEKGHQVAYMGRIYAKSDRALICLSLCRQEEECKQNARRAAGLVEDINKMMDTVFNDPTFIWKAKSFPRPRAEDPLLLDSRWPSFFELIEFNWFDRGWVIQEAALAPEAVVLWAGVQLKYMSLLRAEYWHKFMADPEMKRKDKSTADIPRLHLEAFAFRQEREVKTMRSIKQRYSTLEMINAARQMKLKEPKDRIYAFMEIPWTSDGTLSRLDLAPNYSREVSHLDVYRDFAIKYLKLTADLDLLTFVEHDSDNEEPTSLTDSPSVPTWVPRWDRGGDCYSFFDPHRSKIHDLDSQSDQRSVHIQEGDSILRVRGVIIDTVKWAARALERKDGGLLAAKEVVSLWRDVAHNDTSHPRSGCRPLSAQDRARAFLSALTQNGYEGDRDNFHQFRRTFAELLEHDDLNRPIDYWDAQNAAAQRVSLTAITYNKSRKMVLLDRHYYGVVPQSTRSGDVCAIIYGTRQPFILRKVADRDGHYMVVGAAWIQSKDDWDEEYGRPWQIDSWNWKDEVGDLPTQDIYLC